MPLQSLCFAGYDPKPGWGSPSHFPSKKNGDGYFLPLTAQNRVIAYLALTGMPKEPSEKIQHLLIDYARLVVSNAAKSEELSRLSATIRPRAIALSTVHTVHRIINSTLNLDELVSRLAHLTAQVLRVHSCALYLLDGNPNGGDARSTGRRKSSTLVC